jgi:hypothetical protein
MNSQIQFVTNEKGEQTGVLLNIDHYYQLVSEAKTDPDILVGLSIGELKALSESKLTLTQQSRLDVLIAKQKTGSLSKREIKELDQLIIMFDQLTLLKTRAKYTLHKMSVPSSG